MIKTYSRTEMLALWKRRHFLEPLRADCEAVRSDGVDLDRLIEPQMRAWYLDLLRNGPLEMVRQEDISRGATAELTSRGTVMVKLPSDVVRVTAVRLPGWHRATAPLTADTPEANAPRNRFSFGGVASPKAIIHPDRTLELFSPASNDNIVPELLMVITDPGEHSYIFDETALM